MADRLDHLEHRVNEVEKGFVELRHQGHTLTDGLHTVHALLKEIRDGLTGDPADESRPGLVGRIDRVEQRAKSRDKLLFGICGAVVGLVGQIITELVK